MTNILFIVRVKKRPEDDPGYNIRRVRSAVGEVEDWIPETTWPGNAIIDNPQYRIIRVTGAAMTPAIADMICSGDVLGAADEGKGFLPRHRMYRIKFSDLPAATLANLRNKVLYAVRGTYYDASFTVAQVNSVLNVKVKEARDPATGLPTEANETYIDEP